MACSMVLVISADFRWSPPPYSIPTISILGYLVLICSTKPSRRSMPVWLVWSNADDADLAFAADELGHLVGRQRGRSQIVGRAAGDRDVAVDAGVEGDDRDARILGLLQQRDRRLAVDRRDGDGRRLLGEGRRDHVELAVDGALAVRTFERHGDVEVLGGLFRADLHGLPELMLEALRDQRDVGLVLGQRDAARGEHGGGPQKADECAFGEHVSSWKNSGWLLFCDRWLFSPLDLGAACGRAGCFMRRGASECRCRRRG